MRDPMYHIDPDIRAYASALRGEASGRWHPRQVVHKRTCRRCSRETILELEDGECCQESPEEAWERRAAERAAAIKRLKERTAAMLERMGYPERAAIHRGER